MSRFNQALAGADVIAASVKAYEGDEVRTLIDLPPKRSGLAAMDDEVDTSEGLS
jgi:hypothetical protein